MFASSCADDGQAYDSYPASHASCCLRRRWVVLLCRRPRASSRDKAEITVNKQAQPGSEIDVGGSNFGPNSNVSIYFMSAARANLTNGSASIMQEVPANESTTAATPEGGNFFGNALSALEGLLGMNNGSNTTSSSNASQGSLLVALDDLASGKMNLTCDNQSVAEGDLNRTNLVSLEAPAGTYKGCSISITDGNATNTGDIGSLTITPDPDEGYQNSQVANATADGQGSFASA